jgi:hypothetical protein
MPPKPAPKAKGDADASADASARLARAEAEVQSLNRLLDVRTHEVSGGMGGHGWVMIAHTATWHCSGTHPPRLCNLSAGPAAAPAPQAAQARAAERGWRQRAEAAEAALEQLRLDALDISADMKRQNEVGPHAAAAGAAAALRRPYMHFSPSWRPHGAHSLSRPPAPDVRAAARCGRHATDAPPLACPALCPQATREQLERRIEALEHERAALTQRLDEGAAAAAVLQAAAAERDQAAAGRVRIRGGRLERIQWLAEAARASVVSCRRGGPTVKARGTAKAFTHL